MKGLMEVYPFFKTLKIYRKSYYRRKSFRLSKQWVSCLPLINTEITLFLETVGYAIDEDHKWFSMCILYKLNFELVWQQSRYLIIYLGIFCIKTKVYVFILSLLIQVFCTIPAYWVFPQRIKTKIDESFSQI